MLRARSEATRVSGVFLVCPGAPWCVLVCFCASAASPFPGAVLPGAVGAPVPFSPVPLVPPPGAVGRVALVKPCETL